MKRLKLIVEALKVGVVTRKYPYERPEVPEGYRGKPEFNVNKCVGCTACGNVCTPNAITFVDDLARGVRRLEFYLGRCIFCGRCAEVCPASAITITKDFEVASLSDEDLKLVVEIKLAKCKYCGKHFTPLRHLNIVSSMLESVDADIANLCPECRKSLEVSTLAKVGGIR